MSESLNVRKNKYGKGYPLLALMTLFVFAGGYLVVNSKYLSEPKKYFSQKEYESSSSVDTSEEVGTENLDYVREELMSYLPDKIPLEEMDKDELKKYQEKYGLKVTDGKVDSSDLVDAVVNEVKEQLGTGGSVLGVTSERSDFSPSIGSYGSSARNVLETDEEGNATVIEYNASLEVVSCQMPLLERCYPIVDWAYTDLEGNRRKARGALFIPGEPAVRTAMSGAIWQDEINLRGQFEPYLATEQLMSISLNLCNDDWEVFEGDSGALYDIQIPTGGISAQLATSTDAGSAYPDGYRMPWEIPTTTHEGKVFRKARDRNESLGQLSTSSSDTRLDDSISASPSNLTFNGWAHVSIDRFIIAGRTLMGRIVRNLLIAGAEIFGYENFCAANTEERFGNVSETGDKQLGLEATSMSNKLITMPWQLSEPRGVEESDTADVLGSCQLSNGATITTKPWDEAEFTAKAWLENMRMNMHPFIALQFTDSVIEDIIQQAYFNTDGAFHCFDENENPATQKGPVFQVDLENDPYCTDEECSI